MYRQKFLAHAAAFRTAGAALAVVALGAFGAGEAQADTVHVRYAISLIGLSIGNATMEADVEPSSYKIAAEARLTGLAAVISRVKGAATASGAIVSGKVEPASYATTSADDQAARTVRMAMNSGNVRAVDIAPPFQDAPDRIPVTDAQKRGIIDPLSALVMPVASGQPLVGPAACDRTIPVFDGYTRFDISLTYTSVRTIETKGYSGPVTVCAVRYTPVSGHRPNKDGTKFMADNRDMETWLLPVPGARAVVPYRIAVKTMVGTTVIEAREFRVDSGSTASIRQ